MTIANTFIFMFKATIHVECRRSPQRVSRPVWASQAAAAARRGAWGFRSESKREKNKRMERQGNWGYCRGTPNLGEGITSLAPARLLCCSNSLS